MYSGFIDGHPIWSSICDLLIPLSHTYSLSISMYKIFLNDAKLQSEPFNQISVLVSRGGRICFRYLWHSKLKDRKHI